MKLVLKTTVFLAGLFAVVAALGTLGVAFVIYNGTIRGEAANQIDDAVLLLFVPPFGFALVSALLAPAVWVLDRSGGAHA